MIKDADGRPAAGRERSPSAGLRDQGDRIWVGLHAHPSLATGTLTSGDPHCYDSGI